MSLKSCDLVDSYQALVHRLHYRGEQLGLNSLEIPVHIIHINC